MYQILTIKHVHILWLVKSVLFPQKIDITVNNIISYELDTATQHLSLRDS